MLDGVVLVSPEQYKISYAINPLTNKTSQIDTKRARIQFEHLRDRFLMHDVPVYEITASALNSENRFPDMVFVSNFLNPFNSVYGCVSKSLIISNSLGFL